MVPGDRVRFNESNPTTFFCAIELGIQNASGPGIDFIPLSDSFAGGDDFVNTLAWRTSRYQVARDFFHKEGRILEVSADGLHATVQFDDYAEPASVLVSSLSLI